MLTLECEARARRNEMYGKLAGNEYARLTRAPSLPNHIMSVRDTVLAKTFFYFVALKRAVLVAERYPFNFVMRVVAPERLFQLTWRICCPSVESTLLLPMKHLAHLVGMLTMTKLLDNLAF